MSSNRSGESKKNPRGLCIRTRAELFANKFAFDKDELILLNALNVIDELAEKDRLIHEVERLKDRIELLETVISVKSIKYQIFDITV